MAASTHRDNVRLAITLALAALACYAGVFAYYYWT